MLNTTDMLKRGEPSQSLWKAKAALLLAMLLFGTIGLMRRSIPLSSGVIACARGFIGMIFLLTILKIRGESFSSMAKKRLTLLCLSGGLLGLNWVMVFEAFQYTSVAVASLCYYMEPIFVILASPFLFGERITAKQGACVAVAFLGMALVSGIATTDSISPREIQGVLLALGAGVLYAAVTLMNKGVIAEVSPYDRAIAQLGSASLIVLIYILFTGEWRVGEWTSGAVFLLLVMGIIHTGFVYALYFGTMKHLSAQTIAIFSYIDPIVSVLLSALVLHENLGITGSAGAVLVIGATLASEL